MLSPGTFHKRVPRDPVENMRFRRALLERARGDEKFQAGIWQACQQDILFYINSFVFQTNPNKAIGNAAGPFITWRWQDKVILSDDPKKPGVLWCVENREDVVIEKSRELGLTWLLLIIEDWLCRFHERHDAIMVSKSAAAVESPSHQSLLGKMRFIHEHLPGWLHDRKKFTDQKNFLGYGWTNGTVTGQASTGKAGVSERGTTMLLDEFGQIEEAFEVLYRTAATTKCRIFLSTHMGTGTAFYALTTNEHINKIRCHWTQHPEKNKGMYRWDTNNFKLEFLNYNEETDELEVGENRYEYPADFDFDYSGKPTGGPHPGVRSPWYDKEYRRIGKADAEMAKDQDINPSGSVAQFYQPLVIRDLYSLCKAPLGEYEMDLATGTLVATEGGKIKLWTRLDANGRPPLATYGAGTDISEGSGCTPSCLSICSARTGEKVLEYMDPSIDPKEFATLCVAVCQLFKDVDGLGAKIAWEAQGPGAVFGTRVFKELKYQRVYFNVRDSNISRIVSDAPGWNPTGAARLQLHSDYKLALCERKYVNRSRHALDETLNFKHDGKGGVEHSQYRNQDNPAAGRENHGDIVIADALGWKVIKNVSKAEEGEEVNVARPGTLAWLLQEEERNQRRDRELHPRNAYSPLHQRRRVS